MPLILATNTIVNCHAEEKQTKYCDVYSRLCGFSNDKPVNYMSWYVYKNTSQ